VALLITPKKAWRLRLLLVLGVHKLLEGGGEHARELLLPNYWVRSVPQPFTEVPLGTYSAIWSPSPEQLPCC
jgi:hypothetical protein